MFDPTVKDVKLGAKQWFVGRQLGLPHTIPTDPTPINLANVKKFLEQESYPEVLLSVQQPHLRYSFGVVQSKGELHKFILKLGMSM